MMITSQVSKYFLTLSYFVFSINMNKFTSPSELVNFRLQQVKSILCFLRAGGLATMRCCICAHEVRGQTVPCGISNKPTDLHKFQTVVMSRNLTA